MTMKSSATLLSMLMPVLLLACTKSAHPPATDKETPAVEGQRQDQGAAPAQPAAAPAAGKPGFTPASAELTAHVARFAPLTLPREFPVADAEIEAIKKRPLDAAAYDKYLCGTGFFDCKRQEERNEFFYGYRFDISPKAIGLIYYGIGDNEVQFVLMTYDPSGKPVAGTVLAGDFGDLEWGFSGEITAEPSIQRNRYVWVEGTEKEYVKDQTFRLTEAGEIEEKI